MNFICGTVLFKKDEVDLFETMDAYSGFFTDKGRRYGRVIRPLFTDDSHETQTDNAELAKIAGKRATMKPLTKVDKKKIYEEHHNIIAELLLLFFIGSLLFGIVMMMGSLAIAFLIGIIFTFSLKETLFLMGSVPWHWMFFGTAFSFGALMTIVTFFAKRR